MSVMIKDLDMPINCRACPLSQLSTDHVYVCAFNDSYISDMSVRHKECPFTDMSPSQPKHGSWTKYKGLFDSNWECSECGYLTYKKTDHCPNCGAMVHWFTAEVLTDFCPNCGAEMRGEDNAPLADDDSIYG